MGIVSNLRKGLSEIISPKEVQTEKQIGQFFEMLSGYSPIYTSHSGGVYEMALTRACIDSFATQISKLRPDVRGKNNERLSKLLNLKPNPLQTTSQFLYQVATIFSVANNVLIVPINDITGTEILGYLPTLADGAEVVKRGSRLYLRYQMLDGTKGAVEYEKCGIVNKMQYKNPFFGEGNQALNDTLDLMHSQSEGIKQGIKSGAAVRFLAQLSKPLKPEHVAAERKRFVEANLSGENGGVMMFDTSYNKVESINSEPFIVDSRQANAIEDSVFTYFGTNKSIVQSKFSSADWNAYYESKIEPFAVQLGQVMTAMTFTDRERSHKNEIFLSVNRMQYLTNDEKLKTVTELFDRGFLTHNQGLDIFNLPTIGEAGDRRYIRLEYADKKDVDSDTGEVVTPLKQPESEEENDEDNDEVGA